MNKQLRYVGITYKTAKVEEREALALNHFQRDEIMALLDTKYSLYGVIIISTCNRTEVYYESSVHEAHKVRDVLIDWAWHSNDVKLHSKHFITYDNTFLTTYQLLRVANGLDSSVVGDRQIINQVKEAYHYALKYAQQGSLLERATQAVFKSHKRVANESGLHLGSTSTSYRALKCISDHYGKKQLLTKKVLLIGAGEIVTDILKYLSKFEFKEVQLANRTESKAINLAQRYNIKVLDWERVEANSIEEFDIIVSAVSNRKDIIHRLPLDGKKRFLIDMAVPGNIDDTLMGRDTLIKNIDDISREVRTTLETHKDEAEKVKKIIKEELQAFENWVIDAPRRNKLKKIKEETLHLIEELIDDLPKLSLNKNQKHVFKHKLANQLVKKMACSMNNTTMKQLSKSVLYTSMFDIAN